MGAARSVGVAAALISAVAALAACGPPSTGTIGVGVDAAGRPVGHLKVCEGEHMDGASLMAEPVGDSSRAVASWDARPAATGVTSWAFQNPVGPWLTRRTLPVLKPGVVYSLRAGATDGSGSSGYVLFTLEDLKRMRPGQVRTYDVTRELPAGEPTGSPRRQAQDENRDFMRVISQSEFEREACLE